MRKGKRRNKQEQGMVKRKMIIGEGRRWNSIQKEMKGRKERKMMRKEEGRYSGEKEGGRRSRNEEG